MTSCDTNILFPALDERSPYHGDARSFLQSHAGNSDFCLAEQVLMELYTLLRNPAVLPRPMTAADAVGVIRSLRSNPHWRIVDATSGPQLMETVWTRATEPDFAYRRIFDARLAATIQAHGVTDFATRNLKDFRSLGFRRVWDPLASD